MEKFKLKKNISVLSRSSAQDSIRNNLHNKFRKKYTYIELVQVINDILPGAILVEDDEGQIMIYTNLTEIEDQEELADFEA